MIALAEAHLDPDGLEPQEHDLRRDRTFVMFERGGMLHLNGTLDAAYKYWILGQNAVPHQPRWSIIRNVLHWVE